MLRSRFTPKAERRPATQWEGDTLPGPRAEPLRIADTRARMCVPLPKNPPLRDENYRRWVASLPCARCQIVGYSQACHADEGKGMAIKACDSTCWPGCGPHGGLPGCHWIMGSSGLFTRDYRRDRERKYAEKTEAEAKATGNWPKAWPA